MNLERLARLSLIALALLASTLHSSNCPSGSINCEYHNTHASWIGYEWKNGKQFSKFKHDYKEYDYKTSNYITKTCIILVKCD